MESVKQLFNYDDYRVFLKEYFAEMKEEKPFFSFRYFAAKAGFKSPNFCYYVINGTRNLSKKSLKMVLSALELSEREAQYFEILVNYNQSDDGGQKAEYQQQLEMIRQNLSVKVLEKEMREYASHWYYPVIRELVVYSNWNGNYNKLASMVTPIISESEARNSVKMLERTGLIKKEGSGYIFSDSNLSLNDIPVAEKKRIRQEVFRRGQESLERFSPDKRYTSYATLSMSEDEYNSVTEFLTNMRKKVVSGAESPKPEKVYQLILQLFPVGEIERGIENDEI